jgi:glycosyltransferase involved in cell wall biosynthesis
MYPTLSIVSPVYNEVEGIADFIREVGECVEQNFPTLTFEHLIIDNGSSDGTTQILIETAKANAHLKVIVNVKNFGVAQSGFHALSQASGGVIIFIHSDFEDPIELIPIMFKKWQDGAKVVMCKKTNFTGNKFLVPLRKLFYLILNKLNPHENITGYTGFGLIDRQVLDTVIDVAPNTPFYRGLVAKFGYDFETINYAAHSRRYSLSKNSITSIFYEALNGIIITSLLPLRMITLLGIIISIFSFVVAGVYTFYKIVVWEDFQVGVAPILISLLLMFGVNFIVIGTLAEYIGFIHSNVKKEPFVVERLRLNFHEKKR